LTKRSIELLCYKRVVKSLKKSNIFQDSLERMCKFQEYNNGIKGELILFVTLKKRKQK